MPEQKAVKIISMTTSGCATSGSKKNFWSKESQELKKKIVKFRQDELDHKDIAYESGATKKGLYSVLDKVIKTSSRIAIAISEKI